MKGKILVAIQFISIFLLLIFTQWRTLAWWAYIFLFLSFYLAMWAAVIMRLGNFKIVPHPVEKGTMITNGPYRIIRHPMYASIFLMAFGLLSAQVNYLMIFITVVLITGLVVKMLYEETLLSKHYPNYRIYMLKTKRVIPFIW